jgi:NTP pyrophosphatase (non-canonical NTP hydrolase)
MSNELLMGELRNFVAERDWGQFHTPENLAKSISIEAAELLELFQWSEPSNLHDVQDELADVLTYCLLMADSMGFDFEDIVREKLQRTKNKYPVEVSKGKNVKYDRL